MVLSDIPGTAFDKISMDIVKPLPITESEYSYILTIQDLLTKYLVAVPLKQATSADNRSIRGKVYQPVYRAESMDQRSGTEFYKQSDASYST